VTRNTSAPQLGSPVVVLDAVALDVVELDAVLAVPDWLASLVPAALDEVASVVLVVVLAPLLLVGSPLPPVGSPLLAVADPPVLLPPVVGSAVVPLVDAASELDPVAAAPPPMPVAVGELVLAEFAVVVALPPPVSVPAVSPPTAPPVPLASNAQPPSGAPVSPSRLNHTDVAWNHGVRRLRERATIAPRTDDGDANTGMAGHDSADGRGPGPRRPRSEGAAFAGPCSRAHRGARCARRRATRCDKRRSGACPVRAQRLDHAAITSPTSRQIGDGFESGIANARSGTGSNLALRELNPSPIWRGCPRSGVASCEK
jgi:hypothetical protein